MFELLPKERITIQIAECIYTGMVHDTGVFQYSCTSKKTMDIAGSLMEMGIDYSRIIDDTFYTKTFAQNKIMGQALLNAALYLNGDVILSAVSRAEMEKYDVLPKHLDGIVNQLRVTKDIKVAVFLYENEDGTYNSAAVKVATLNTPSGTVLFSVDVQDGYEIVSTTPTNGQIDPSTDFAELPICSEFHRRPRDQMQVSSK